MPALAQCDIVSFALTDPGADSAAAALRTTATPDDGRDYLINGTKRYIPNAPQASIFTVTNK